MALTLLAAFRTNLRIDLGDPNPPATVWSDADLDRHIAHAVEDLSRADPREETDSIAISGNVVSISTLTTPVPLRVVAVEFPQDQEPKVFERFSRWETDLTLIDLSADQTGTARVYTHVERTLTAGASTLEEHHEPIVALGAAGYALRQAAFRGVNTLNTGGANVDRDYRSAGADALRDFRAALRELKGVRFSQMYAPVEAMRTQTTDPGP